MTQQRPEALGTVLGVWAHPDDETWLSGALMARAVAAGARVVCITATRGEQGSPDENRWPTGAALAEVRTAELDEALGALGVREHHWLDYPDGGCAAVEAAEAVDRIRAVVEQVRPDTVLTFGPDGMTGHPDHQTVSRWAAEALAAAGYDPGRLHYATNTPQWLAQFRPALDELGVFMDAEPPCTDPAELSIHLLAEGSVLDAKELALLSQRSQTEPLVRAVGGPVFRSALAEEAYRPAV